MQLILGGLAGLMLAHDDMLVTLPASIQTFAALMAAAPFSALMGRMGRKAGFLIGAFVTIIGGFIAVSALYFESFLLLCAAHFCFGAGWAAFQYFRFAAGEVVSVEWQPVAISLMLTSGLMAAIVGPELFIQSKDLIDAVPLAGAYMAMSCLALAGILPLLIAKMPKPKRQEDTASTWRNLQSLRNRTVKQAIGLAAVSQGIMVFLMVPTPIAMVACGFNENIASDVIRWHIVAMFAPSFFTGFLIKRFGALPIAYIGLTIIIIAAFYATQGISSVHFYAALIMLGVGWNFSFIGATTMLAAAVSEDEKTAVQGLNDTVIALVSVICAFSAGFFVSRGGWTVVALISTSVVFFMLMVFVIEQVAHKYNRKVNSP